MVKIYSEIQIVIGVNSIDFFIFRDCRGRDRMLVGFTHYLCN